MTSQPHEIYSAIQTDAYTTYTVVTGWESRCTVRGTEKNFQSCWSRYSITEKIHIIIAFMYSTLSLSFLLLLSVVEQLENMTSFAVAAVQEVVHGAWRGSYTESSASACVWCQCRVMQQLTAVQSDAAADCGADDDWWMLFVVLERLIDLRQDFVVCVHRTRSLPFSVNQIVLLTLGCSSRFVFFGKFDGNLVVPMFLLKFLSTDVHLCCHLCTVGTKISLQSSGFK